MRTSRRRGDDGKRWPPAACGTPPICGARAGCLPGPSHGSSPAPFSISWRSPRWPSRCSGRDLCYGVDRLRARACPRGTSRNIACRGNSPSRPLLLDRWSVRLRAKPGIHRGARRRRWRRVTAADRSVARAPCTPIESNRRSLPIRLARNGEGSHTGRPFRVLFDDGNLPS